MKKWLIGIIVVLVIFILSLAFIPKDIFDGILYSITGKIYNVKEKKINQKEAEGKGIEKSVQSLVEQNKKQAKTIEKLKSQRDSIKPTNNTSEVRKEFAKLGYTTK